MGHYVRSQDLNQQILNEIYDKLTLRPIVPYNKYNRYNKPTTEEIIEFFRADAHGIHLPYLFSASLLQILPNINLPYASTTFVFKGTLKEEQVPVESEAWGHLNKYGTTTLGLYPGFGKTILGASLSCRAKLFTAILVHREILTVQWKKTYNEFTDAKVWIVGEPNPPPICDVIICMDQRWNMIPQEMRDAVGFLIIDEAHIFCTKGHVDCLLKAFHPKFIVAETATLERDDGMESMIYNICGNHGIYIEFNKAFTVYKINTNIVPERKLNRQKQVDWAALIKTLSTDERRNDLVLALVQANCTCTILILTALVEHTLLLNEMIQKEGIGSDYMCGKKNDYMEGSVLVGTMSKIGTGFDQSTMCKEFSGRRFNLVILVSSIKKYSNLVQYVGRGLRADNPTVFDLVDNDSIFQNHWNIRKRWYTRRNAKMIEHDIPNIKPVFECNEWLEKKRKELQQKSNIQKV